MAPDWTKLEQGFRDAIVGLPNYRRAIVWDYVNALKQEIEAHTTQRTQDKIAGQILSGEEPE